jgi:hypothetical protein
LHLREYRRPVRLSEVVRNNADLPAGAAFPSIAIPLVCDRDIRAIALYGGHDSGTDLSPDEISCLEALVAAGSAAYEHLRNVALQRQIEALRRQLARTSNAPANAPTGAPAT